MNIFEAGQLCYEIARNVPCTCVLPTHPWPFVAKEDTKRHKVCRRCVAVDSYEKAQEAMKTKPEVT